MSTKELLVKTGAALIILLVGFYILTFKYRMEAKTYNKLCHPTVKATTWDAMWVHLRVGVCR